MPKFATFVSATDPAPVLGWYDTDALTYDNLPAASNLLELTDAEWDARLANPAGWAVSGGKLVAHVPPAPVPQPITILSPRAFLARFTDAETLAIFTAAQSNVSIMIWKDKALAGDIDLTDPLTAAGLEALVSAGLLTEARKAAILTP